jgi:DNA adenine methylase
MPQVADYQPLFQYFGGKARVAQTVWDRLGNVGTYVEPFFGSGAMLFRRPPEHFADGDRRETVNDFDGMIANFWRAVQADPEAVAAHADWPCNEVDLTARHIWVVNQKPALAERMQADPEYFDAKIAGRWVWGLCWWIGTGYGTGNGCWNTDGQRLVKMGQGVNRQRPHLGDDGRGDPHEGRCDNYTEHVLDQILRARDRLRRVRVCCGDWARVCTPAAAGYCPTHRGTVGIFLDPPYGTMGERSDCYTHEDYSIAGKVTEWAKTAGADPRVRICIAGYEGETHGELEALGWDVVAWKAGGGMAGTAKNTERGKDNAKRERLWFSPHCVKPEAPSTGGLYT